MYNTLIVEVFRLSVKVQNTRELDELAATLLNIVSFLNAPQRDEALLKGAGVDLDRALFPLLMRLGMQGALSVAELSDQAGRDHTTVSRQLARLANLHLIERCPGASDRRQTVAELTPKGRDMFKTLLNARRHALAQAVCDWPNADRRTLITLLGRFSESLEQVSAS